MSDSGAAQNPDRQARLERVLADYLHSVEKGQPLDRSALIAAHPDLADDLQSFFRNHDSIGRLAVPLNAAAAEAPTITGMLDPEPAQSGMTVRYFGDYELLDEIARGGMGVVYKARQVNLNRVVALKMILAGQLANDSDVKRFYAEAEAAAKLDHPGIVPIFEIGQHDGQHYFSMAFVEGESLAKKVIDGPMPPRDAAEMVRKVADAVEYAHQKGIIHRDLKPANVLLDGHGQPKVTDFGLAKQTQGDSGLTGTGQILGTPSYMPPEQASGKLDEVGPPSDVYALGAILYCLLTGRPPFQAASPLDTLKQVLEQEPVAPRQLNPHVPLDLETIALKCLEKEPARRYAKGVDLADELGRFLRGEPILARPVGPVERTWHWCKRNRALAGLTAATALSLIVGIIGSSYFAIKERDRAVSESIAKQDALTQKGIADENARRADEKANEAQANALEARANAENEAKQRAIAELRERESQEAKERAEAARREATTAQANAMSALRGTTDDAIEQLIGSRPVLGPSERAYLERSLRRWQGLAAEQGDSEQSRAIRAEGTFRVAALRGKLGDREASISGYGQAILQFAELATDFPQVPQYRWYLAGSHSDTAIQLKEIGDLAKSREHFENALQAEKQLAAEFPAAVNYRNDLAGIHFNLANLLRILGDRPAALAHLQSALELGEALVAELPGVARYRLFLAGNYNALATVLHELGRRSESGVQFERALTVAQKLDADFPAVPNYRSELALIHNNFGHLLHVSGNDPRALSQYARALAIGEKLVAEFPGVPTYRQDCAAAHTNLGILLVGRGEPAEAAEQYRKALALIAKLAADAPGVPAYRRELAGVNLELGDLLVKLGQDSAARQHYQQGIVIREKLVADFPNVADFQIDLGGTYVNCGIRIRSNGDAAESLNSFERAITLLRPLAGNEPPPMMAREFLRNGHWSRALAFEQLARHAEALQDWNKAVEFSPAAEQPNLRIERAFSSLRNGKMNEGVDEITELTKSSNWNAGQWYRLACAYAFAGDKDPDKREEFARRTVELLRKAVRMGFKDVSQFRNDTNLDPLRDRDDFKMLLADLDALN